MINIEEKFRELKERYNNAILFFKLGEYYNTYYEDAKIVARECWFLERNKETCSVPEYVIDECVDMLEIHGYKVEILREET